MLSAGCSFNCLSQSDKYIGLEVNKSLLNNALGNSAGFVIEPILVIRPAKDPRIRIKTVAGYAYLRKDKVYVNSNMLIQGGYLKVGAGFAQSEKVVPKINLTLTGFSTRNTFTLEGPYFGDYKGSYKTFDFCSSLEPNLDFYVSLINRWLLIVSLRVNLIFYNTSDKELPTYYIPGMGIVFKPFLTTGVSFYCVFK